MTGLAAESAWREGVLSRPLPQNGPREFYLPGIIDPDARVTPLAWKGSADIFTLARANVLLMRKENAPAVAVGERVRVLEIPS
jgi:molybdopterin biosynthesis enzyme